jgi:hypothetical protein
LGKMQALSCAGDVLLLRHDDEVTEVAKFHEKEHTPKAFSAKQHRLWEMAREALFKGTKERT